MYVTQNGSTPPNYPIYDAHGNMISTLAKQGTGGYTFSALRTFDAWGNIRLGAQSGDPKGRYCANLGHKQDDESGLLYMRARYYEPLSGRFLNDDPQGSGSNWQIYCSGDPVNQSDGTGKFGENQTVNAVLMWAIAMIIDQLERFGIEIPKGPSLIMKDLLKGALLTAGALEMSSSLQNGASLMLILGMDCGQPEILGAAAGMYALAGVFLVVAGIYAYETAVQIDIDDLDS
jgi:RHS repeat-associated protein